MYMKKNFFYAAALAMGLTFSMTACSSYFTPQRSFRLVWLLGYQLQGR